MIAKFTAEDLARANSEWGCSCGPAAFAFACGLTLDEARKFFPDFRGWCNTKMMRNALGMIGREGAHAKLPDMFGPEPRIVRIEFTGPWTGTQWAAHHSHWIATIVGPQARIGDRLVYDVNNDKWDGVLEAQFWKTETIPELLKRHKRATGWRPTNVFLVTPRKPRPTSRVCQRATLPTVAEQP